MGKLHANLLLFLFTAAATLAYSADETFDATPIISALFEVTVDADADVRYAAFNALKDQPRSDRLVELFWRGLEDERLQIRTLSLDKIVDFEGPKDRVLERLVLLMNKRGTGEDLALARQARSRLISLGAPAIPYLIDAIKKNEMSFYALSALGTVPLGKHRETVITLLTELLKSENKEVRLAAVQALQSVMVTEAKANAQARTRAEDPYLRYYGKLLQKYDSNSDGSLTKDEWSKMSKDPAAADTDQDGKITVAELAKWSQSR